MQLLSTGVILLLIGLELFLAYTIRKQRKVIEWQVRVIEDVTQAYHESQEDTEYYKKGLAECEAYLLEDVQRR